MNWAKTRPDIRAIHLVGSAARTDHPADQYSDRDILLFVTDPDSHVYLDWVQNYAPTWAVIHEEHAPTRLWIIFFKGDHKVHWSVNAVADLQSIVDKQELWTDHERGYKILIDKDGLSAQMPAPTIRLPYDPPSEEQFIKLVEKYCFGLAYVGSHLKRRNLWTVKQLSSVQQRFFLQMLEWHTHATHDGYIDTWNRGQFMQEWVSVDIWQELHSIFAHFDAEDSWRALFAGMTLFRRLAEETAAKSGFSFPTQMVDEVTAYVEGLRHK